MIKVSFFLMVFFCANFQNGCCFQEKFQTKQKVSFQLLTNLIVISAVINSQELSFI
jgi:hypothetical protein